MAIYEIDTMRRVTFVQGVDILRFCKRCRASQLYDGRTWMRRWSRKIPKSRQLIQQTAPGGVFHIVDRDTGKVTCVSDE